MSSIKWNPRVKLVLSDVDGTVADVYLPAENKLIVEINKLLINGVKLYLISGGGLDSICERVVYKVKPELRKNILVSHCSGSEVWGFDDDGILLNKPFYSVYEESLNKKQCDCWRKVVSQIINEFDLKIFPTMPIAEFKNKSSGDPLSIMYDDRGPQITFEVVNGTDLNNIELKSLGFKVNKSHGKFDIRLEISKRADKLFNENDLPINSRIEGTFCINFAIKGVSKETSVRKILDDSDNLKYFQLNKNEINNPDYIEIWGDKFSELYTHHDSLMSRSVDPRVRSIDFRQENEKEFPKGYNIHMWDGKYHLQDGLLEYLEESLN